MPRAELAEHGAATDKPSPHDQEVLALASSLRLSATRLARMLRQQSETGLTLSQLSALTVIERHGPLTLGSLAAHERVAPPSVTKVVHKLEAQGLIEREGDEGDRRIWRVAITSHGQVLLEETRRRRNAWLAARLRQLDPEERSRLSDALAVLDKLTSELGT